MTRCNEDSASLDSAGEEEAPGLFVGWPLALRLPWPAVDGPFRWFAFPCPPPLCGWRRCSLFLPSLALFPLSEPDSVAGVLLGLLLLPDLEGGFDVEGVLRCPRLPPPEAPEVGFLISLDVSRCSSVISFIRLRRSVKNFLEFYLFLSVCV